MAISLQRWLAAFGLAAAVSAFAAESPQVIVVTASASGPTVDGNLAEWGSEGWQTVAVKPALSKDERAKFGLDPLGDKNVTGDLVVQLKASVHQGRFYLAVKYPDPTEDSVYKGWQWRSDRYQEKKLIDDMFAVRFHMSGEFNRSMLSDKEYKVDVWQWSAGRSNQVGHADDLTHFFTTRMIDAAAEYTLADGRTLYIKKQRDEGTPSFKTLPRPRAHQGDSLPAVGAQTPSGSASDVAAKGVWDGGHWHTEFARALDTGHGDDVAFRPGQKILGQIAVFNRGNSEHKSVSEPLLFDFSNVQ